jgi:putative transcriptional regulator
VKREWLLGETRKALAKTGFYLSQPHRGRGLSFDVVARRDDTLLIVKVFQNVDALSKETAQELKGIARTLQGSPLIIGERTGSGPLEDGVIYSRFGVPILCRSTLLEFLEEGVPPFLFSAPGGLYVRLDTLALRRLRDARSLSLGALAEIAGVSRRTIQMYIEGMAATLDVAMRLEDFLQESLALPADPFRFVDEPRGGPEAAPRLERFERELYQRLERLGYDVLPTVRSPFDALSRHEETTYLTGVGGAESGLDRKAEIVSDISRVVEKDSVMFVVRRSVRMSIRGVPLIGREELRHAKDTDDVEALISERKR